MVSAVSVAPSQPLDTAATQPRSRQFAFAQRDRFERTTPPLPLPLPQAPPSRPAGNSLCNLFLGVVLCPVRCVTNWSTLILCCPFICASAVCMNGD